MHFRHIEEIFARSWAQALSQKKGLLMFLFLLFCGSVGVVCQTFSLGCGPWVRPLLLFVPGFLMSGLLFAAALFFSRVYYHEVKGLAFSYRRIFVSSLKVILGVAQVAVPLVLAYIVLWMVLGLFFLAGQLPFVGDLLTTVLSFAPFLLSLATLGLALSCAFALFLATPHLAFQVQRKGEWVKKMGKSFSSHLLSHFLLFAIAAAPLLLLIALFYLAGSAVPELPTLTPLAWGVRAFFLMVPMALCLSPALLFFINFSVESHNLLRKMADPA